VNHDLAGYHISANADIKAVRPMLDELILRQPDGSKGVGEVCIVGTPPRSRTPTPRNRVVVCATCRSRSTELLDSPAAA